jgi:flagellar protein FliS
MSVGTYSHPKAYRDNAVLSATPGQLVVMLYDGARRFLHQAAVTMREGDIPASHARLRRAEEIIAHLAGVLDLEQGGEVAASLNSLYDFWQRHLMKARFEKDPKKVEQVAEQLGRLRDSWAAIAAQQR